MPEVDDGTGGRVTRTEYARMRGVTHQGVSWWIRKGVIRLDADKRFDPEEADRAVQQYARGRNSPNSQKLVNGRTPLIAGGKSAAEVNLQRDHYRAELARLEFEEKSGKLVDGGVVKAAAFDAGRRVREAMCNIPPRVEALLQAEVTAATGATVELPKVRAILDGEITRALLEFVGETGDNAIVH